MTILTSYTSATYKAQIRSSLETGFRQIYTGTCTEGHKSAARHVMTKYFGYKTEESLREVTDHAEILSLIGKFMDDPNRKQTFRIWTFNHNR